MPIFNAILTILMKCLVVLTPLTQCLVKLSYTLSQGSIKISGWEAKIFLQNFCPKASLGIFSYCFIIYQF